jgi:hypothetical protein
VATVMVIIVMVTIIVLVIGSGSSSGCNQRNGGDSGHGVFALMFAVTVRMVSGFHDKIGRTAIIHPDAAPVIIPIPALLAISPGVLSLQPDITVRIDAAHVVLVIFAFTTDILIRHGLHRHKRCSGNSYNGQEFNFASHFSLSRKFVSKYMADASPPGDVKPREHQDDDQ